MVGLGIFGDSWPGERALEPELVRFPLGRIITNWGADAFAFVIVPIEVALGALIGFRDFSDFFFDVRCGSEGLIRLRCD